MKNPFKNNRLPDRHGITIVEVLTSIIVAVIGVAGVLVLIPFGIRQAQVGLDLDDSITMADNAMARFELEGYRRIDETGNLPWINVDAYTTNQGALVNESLAATGSFYWIDPLWTNSQTDPADVFPPPEFFGYALLYFDPANQQFIPRDLDGAPPADNIPPEVEVLWPEFVTLLNPTFDPAAVLPDPRAFLRLPQAMVARMFLTNEDLQFSTTTDPITGLEIDGADPPQQYPDIGIDAAGNPVALRRQSRGEISWSAIAIPTGDPDLLDFYVLVFKNRSFENPVGYSGDPKFDPRFLVTTIDSAAMDATTGLGFRSGGRVYVNAPIDIANDEWVMMANTNPLTGEFQAGFYRVIGSNPEAQLDSDQEPEPTISLIGPDFLFDDPTDNTTATIVIYLKNVVNVHRHSLTPERDSNFNQ